MWEDIDLYGLILICVDGYCFVREYINLCGRRLFCEGGCCYVRENIDSCGRILISFFHFVLENTSLFFCLNRFKLIQIVLCAKLQFHYRKTLN